MRRSGDWKGERDLRTLRRIRSIRGWQVPEVQRLWMVWDEIKPQPLTSTEAHIRLHEKGRPLLHDDRRVFRLRREPGNMHLFRQMQLPEVPEQDEDHNRLLEDQGAVRISGAGKERIEDQGR